MSRPPSNVAGLILKIFLTKPVSFDLVKRAADWVMLNTSIAGYTDCSVLGAVVRSARATQAANLGPWLIISKKHYFDEDMEVSLVFDSPDDSSSLTLDVLKAVGLESSGSRLSPTKGVAVTLR